MCVCGKYSIAYNTEKNRLKRILFARTGVGNCGYYYWFSTLDIQ